MRAFLPLLGCLALAPAIVQAATLRPMTELHGPVVKLSDLFDALDTTTDRPLGPAPAPGGRVVVQAAQLAAIARQFGVAWHSTSNADRSVLERPGRPLARAAVLAAVREALIATGVDEECDVDLAGFIPPMVPTESGASAVVSQLDHDQSSGRFTAILSVSAAAMEPIQMRLAGKADVMREIVVAAARLPAGTVLRAQDLRPARMRASLILGEVAEVPADAVGMQLRHQAMVGRPLKRSDLMPPTLVQKGGLVKITLDSPGIVLEAQGQALEDAGLGARVHVLNPASRAVLEVEVTGAGQVRVLPETTPVITNARSGFSSPGFSNMGFAGQVAGR